MVYAPPSPTDALEAGPARPNHRRSRSSALFSDGVGYAPTGPPALPRRRSGIKKAFYLDDESPSPEDADQQEERSPLSPLIINDGPTFPSLASFGVPQRPPAPPAIQTGAGTAGIPFPRAAGPLSPEQPMSPRPMMMRSPSASIVLSNGKPLKPSLKSSQSSPHIPDELRVHSRARSEPSTPSVKSVHFRDEDDDGDLEEVRVYNRAGRPANLLLKAGEETETETEAEGAFPFPRTPSPGTPPVAPTIMPFELDVSPGKTSAVPRPNLDAYANIYLESLTLPSMRPAALRGSILVRNVAFEKNVAVRFTTDDWQTTSEVFCKHVVSLPSLPPPFPRAHTLGDLVAPAATTTWDRFSFSLALEDFAGTGKLADRTLFLVARFTAPGHGEWWDNNAGANYRVRFRRTASRSVSVPATPAVAATPAAPIAQQRSFVAPSSVRLTPHSSAAAGPSPLAASHSASPAGSPLTTPAAAPAPAPAQTPAQAYVASITQGRRVVSPVASPRGGSPAGGSPPGSDTERKRARPGMSLGLGLGLGLGPSGQRLVRPGMVARSASSPSVYSPASADAALSGFLGGAAPTPARRPEQSQGVPADPLVARLKRLSLRNYAAPGQPAAPSPQEPTAPAPALTVTAATPSPRAEQPSPEADGPGAPATSPLDSQDGSAEHSSASSSASNSPLPGTPRLLSLSDLPPFAPGGGWGTPGAKAESEPDSDASGDTIRRSADGVLNLPSPAARGAPNAPFSPLPTPRFSIDAGLLRHDPAGRASPMRDSVRAGGAEYAALLRQWCFARSPSPGTPVSEGLPAQPAAPADALERALGPLALASPPSPPTLAAPVPAVATISVRLAPHAGPGAQPRTGADALGPLGPLEPPLESVPWLSVGAHGWEAGRA